MNRYVLPSIRTSPSIDCTTPVQCRVGASVSLSAIDHTLKYGSWVISGTAGGRNAAFSMNAVEKNRLAVRRKVFKRLIETPRISFTRSRTAHARRMDLIQRNHELVCYCRDSYGS